MVAVYGVIGTATGVVLTALVAWLIARRKTSGRISTTEAETLWREADAMRAALRSEVEGLRTEVQRMREEVVTLRSEAVSLRTELLTVRVENAEYRNEIAELRSLLGKRP